MLIFFLVWCVRGGRFVRAVALVLFLLLQGFALVRWSACCCLFSSVMRFFHFKSLLVLLMRTFTLSARHHPRLNAFSGLSFPLCCGPPPPPPPCGNPVIFYHSYPAVLLCFSLLPPPGDIDGWLDTSLWEEVNTSGQIPSIRSCPSWCKDGDNVYVFGGYDGVQVCILVVVPRCKTASCGGVCSRVFSERVVRIPTIVHAPAYRRIPLARSEDTGHSGVMGAQDPFLLYAERG